MPTSVIVLIYGVLVALGGILGYVKAGSMPSLVAGVGSGILLVGASLAMMRGMYEAGWWVALVVTLLLIARFGSVAASQGFKMMPGGMVIILSVISLAALLADRFMTKAN